MNGVPPLRLVIFWDYDTQWGAERSRGAGGPKSWGRLEFENTERLLEIHAEYSVPACFAVVGAAALPGERPYHDPDQIRRIALAGHEVASHGFEHEWLPDLGLARLRVVLRESKAVLEECIGERVETFVPPYNQPFDYPARGSFSYSERRTAGRQRIGLRRLCEELGASGYRLCRVAYRSLPERWLRTLLGHWTGRPRGLVRIGGVLALRLSQPAGFPIQSLRWLEEGQSRRGVLVVYGHPHSLSVPGPQDEANLRAFLERVRDLCRLGRLQAGRPKDLLSRVAPHGAMASAGNGPGGVPGALRGLREG